MKIERTIKTDQLRHGKNSTWHEQTFQDFSEREKPDELFFKEKESKIEIMFRRSELWMSHNCTHIPFLGIRHFCGDYLKAWWPGGWWCMSMVETTWWKECTWYSVLENELIRRKYLVLGTSILGYKRIKNTAQVPSSWYWVYNKRIQLKYLGLGTG